MNLHKRPFDLAQGEDNEATGEVAVDGVDGGACCGRGFDSATVRAMESATTSALLGILEIQPGDGFCFNTSPIRFIPTTAYVFLETAVRIIQWASSTTMFDRVVMNVIDMVGVVNFVPDNMIPKAALPYMRRRGDLVCLLVIQCEIAFNGMQQFTDVGCFWDKDEQMEMIGHKGIRSHLKRIICFRDTHRGAQNFHVGSIRKDRLAFFGHTDDEVHGVGHIPTTDFRTDRFRCVFVHRGYCAIIADVGADSIPRRGAIGRYGKRAYESDYVVPSTMAISSAVRS